MKNPRRTHKRQPKKKKKRLVDDAGGDGRAGRSPARRPAEREHVQVRVIPAEDPWHTGLGRARSSSLGLPDGAELAYIDNQLRGRGRQRRPADVASLGQQVAERHRRGAAPPASRSS